MDLGKIVFVGLLVVAQTTRAQSFFESVRPEMEGLPGKSARGISMGDYNNDGWPDLLLSGDAEGGCCTKGPLVIYSSLAGRDFAKTAVIPPDPEPFYRAGGSLFGDYDNDGDLDVFGPIGLFDPDWARPNTLLRNDRGTFVDVTEQAGLTDALPTDNALWLDYDRDGWLDLYTGNLGAPEIRNKLYRNQTDGTFADMTQVVGLGLSLQDSLGGTNGGIAASDFDNDGWPDLYIGVFKSPNFLFLNREGLFVEATPSDLKDPSIAYGTAVGDINNNGLPDIFQSSGGLGIFNPSYRPQLYLNLDAGQFVDALEGVGLGKLIEGQTYDGGLLDIDNDGDLDLLTTRTTEGGLNNGSLLYLNDGAGVFSEATDRLGYHIHGLIMAVGDYNNDGFLDIFGSGEARKDNTLIGAALFRNRGNANHWLRLDLVGVASNRDGIGARVTAISGTLQQTRQLLGGLGFAQDELVLHFGLGPHTQVDQLEIRWPSGQIDVLANIPADQKIRVIEAQGRYHPTQPMVWNIKPDSIQVRATVPVTISVEPALFEADAEIAQVSADLRAWGGTEDTPLLAQDNGTYKLETTLTGPAKNGLQLLSVQIEQLTSQGPYWTNSSKRLAVLPAGDLLILAESLAWQVETSGGAQVPQIGAQGPVFQGEQAGIFHTEPESRVRPWQIEFRPAAQVDPLGYTTLHLAFHPGDTGGASFNNLNLAINGQSIADLIRDETSVDLEQAAWQVIEIPLETKEPITSLTLLGNLNGIFYLDDLRLVTPYAPITAVLEERDGSAPQAFSLDQNYPNPFNSGTVIRFALPQSEAVELSVYNLAGQRIIQLVEGLLTADTYTVHWDGRDGEGRQLASGVYLYRLRFGSQLKTRKLLLLR